MWKRFKRLIRSILGWLIDLGEDPELILRQNIRDLQDQIPQINENLARIKAQVTLAENNLRKLNQREEDLTAKIKAALQNDRRDVARNFASTLEEVRREKAEQEKQRELAQQTFEKAEQSRKVFLKQIEAKIDQAKRALNAKQQAEWQSQVADTLSAGHGPGVDATHDEMIDKIERDAARAEAKLELALEGGRSPDVDWEEEARKMQADDTLRQIEMEMGLGGDISAPPEEPTPQEKTLGERESA